jgi:hypothetical protein
MFTEKFNSYVVPGDSISTEVEGFKLVAKLEHDNYYGIDDDDMHNPDQTVTGVDQAGQEKILAARKAYQNGEWAYGGIVIESSYKGVPLVSHSASLWGIEYNYPEQSNEYLTEVANELLPEALEEAKSVLAEMRAKLL